MAEYVKHVDGKYILFLIPVKEDNGKTDQKNGTLIEFLPDHEIFENFTHTYI